MDRPLVWLPMLLLLRATAFAGDRCLMKDFRPAPKNANLANDVLWVGQPKRPYPKAAYRQVPGACMRKCCPPNKAYVKTQCSPLNASLSVFVFEGLKFVNARGTVDAFESALFHLVYGKLTCAENSYASLNENNNFRVTKAGRLLNKYGDVIAEPGQFCLEQFSEHNFQMLAVVCVPKEWQGNIFYTIGMIISIPFLFSTFLVYALIRDLRNLHGKSLMCHVAMLLVAYTSLTTVQFITNDVNKGVNKEFCVFLAYTIQFSFIASFFWLNVMCFDLWWTFSGFRPLRGNTNKYKAKKFIIYSIYAWGGTTLISIITFGMEKFSYLLFDIVTIRPGFGIKSCWFVSFSTTLIYFYGPIGILLFSNLLMFIHTAIMIVKHMKDARVLSGSESQKNVDHEKQRFMLYFKLFIVMGVNWLAEVISWATGSDDSVVWCVVTDIGNSLQGVVIFLIFVCKKRVLILLNKKLCPRFQLFKASTSVRSVRTASV